MPYLYNTPEDETAMLAAIGAGSIDELFAMVPAEMRLKRPLAIPPAMTEIELTQHMTALAAKNEHASSKGLLPRRRQLRPFHPRRRR